MIVRVLKSSAFLLLALTVLASGLIPAATEKVRASHDVPHGCAVPPNDPVVLYGRDELCGYFLNNPYIETAAVDGIGLLTGMPQPCTSPWQDALLGVNNIEQFVCAIRFNLLIADGFWRTTTRCGNPPAGGDSQRRNAASFIVLTMLGYGGGTPANHACNVFSTWEARVRQYAAAGRINFNHYRSFQQNTMIHTSSLDPMWYHNSTISHVAGDTRWSNSITFTAPNGSILYSIKKDCANPIGITGALPNLGHGFDARPNASVSVSPSEENPVTASFDSGVSYSGAPFRAEVRRRYFIIRTTGATQDLANLVGTRTFTGSSYDYATEEIDVSGRNLQAGDRLCANTTIAPAAGTAGPTGAVTNVTVGSRSSSNVCVTIVGHPYFRAYGGDAQVGAGFGNSCQKGSARIAGMNRGTNPFTGAGAQLAAFAIGQINDFATGTAWSPAEPNFLSFARSGSGGNFDAVYGGGLTDGHVQCIPDYFATYTGGATDPGPTLNINPASDVTYFRNGNLTLTQASFTGLEEGEDMTIYVDGNVFIQESIVYRDTSNYDNANEIPSFRLIVRGNIYVGPGVSRLDGLYIAQPDTNDLSEESGRFYTCGYAFRSPTTAELTSACNNRLTVYGAVIANIIKLTRTNGSVRNSAAGSAEYLTTGGNPAEIFIYSPELWLKGGLGGGDGFDAVVSLPPVL